MMWDIKKDGGYNRLHCITTGNGTPRNTQCTYIIGNLKKIFVRALEKG